MKRQLMRATAAQPLPDPEDTPDAAVPELDGVRRKALPTPPAPALVPPPATGG
jgi:hypothetical protein